MIESDSYNLYHTFFAHTFYIISDAEDKAIVSPDYSLYARGSLSCSNQEWFHGELTRVEAEQALAASDCDCFLIRESEGGLVLSLTHHGQVHHVAVKYGPGWYKLEGGSAQLRFTELKYLVSYYHGNTISESLQATLGQSCQRTNTHVSTGNSCTTSKQVYIQC